MSATLVSCSEEYNDSGETLLGPNKAATSIFGGEIVETSDPVSLSSIALLEGDGEQVCSGTLIASNVIVTAAHCFTSFTPYYVSFGPLVAEKTFWTDNLSDRTKFPNIREIDSHTIHPKYDRTVTQNNEEELRPANDIAVAMIVDGAPAGFSPARVIAPSSSLASEITIAGFGAHPDYDPQNPETPRLRRVDTFIGTLLPQSKLFKDGPNPGKGSCVRDSGGSIYLRTNSTDIPVVIGNVVSGPWDCSEGTGYNTDFRYYVTWMEKTAGIRLTNGVVDPKCKNGVLDDGETCDNDTVACTEIDAELYASGLATCNNTCNGYNLDRCQKNTQTNSCIEEACVQNVSLPIPDNRSTGISSTIHVDSFAGTATNIHVTVDIDHTYRGDLYVELTSPEGTTKILHNKTGRGADDLHISQTIADFRGENPTGDFTLFVSDNSSRDVGSLLGWSIQLF